jgi:hypothetical protein
VPGPQAPVVRLHARAGHVTALSNCAANGLNFTPLRPPLDAACAASRSSDGEDGGFAPLLRSLREELLSRSWCCCAGRPPRTPAGAVADAWAGWD